MSQQSLEEFGTCQKDWRLFDQVLANMKWRQRERLHAEPSLRQARIVHAEAADYDR